MKLLVLAGLIILGAGIISAFLTGFRTDPTPPEVRAGWYLPGQDIVWTNSGSGINQSRNEHLILTGWQNGPAPQFPDLSPYSRYENYTSQSTGHNYLIAVWYFNDDNRFLASQKNLRDFLEDSGKITTVELNFTGFATTENRSGQMVQNSQEKNHVPAHLITTGYESTNTTGLFFAVVMPGLNGNNEHYIVYYGTTDHTANPADSASTQFLREIIGETYTYDRGSTAVPLFS
ncbi:MAG: hypothetical protein WBL42_04810 [Methanoregula sp.]